MKKTWKIVLIIAIVLLVLGVVAAVVGLLTGASADRMVEVVFGGREALEMLLSVLRDELSAVFN